MLSFIPTPIGNREDITLRALRLLRDIEVFFCEDTGTAKKLLNMYEISLIGKQFFSLTSFTDTSKLQHYITIIREKDCGVLCEAGTPGLSDPGKNLIKVIRENNLPFEVLPGPTALIPTIVSAYCDTSSFVFMGFLPMKKGRQTMLKKIIHECNERPYFFYESVHRVEKCIDELITLGYTGKMYIAREISKMFEQKIRGTPHELKEAIKLEKLVIKGEFVVGMWSHETP